MRVRSLIAAAAIAAATTVSLPAVANNNPTTECGAGAPFAKYGSQLAFQEGVNVAQLTVASTKGREVMGFTWTSSTPIRSFVVKAGKSSTTVLSNGLTSGSFTVPQKYAISHVTFCLAPVPPPVDLPPVDVPPVDLPPVDVPPVDLPPVDLPPVDVPPVDVPPVDAPPVETPPQVVTAAGRARFICWGQESAGYYAVFSYNNQSTDQHGQRVSVDRATARFATSHPTLASQFPTTFLPTTADTFSAAIEFKVSGWDGVSNLTFELFGTTKFASLKNESQMCL